MRALILAAALLAASPAAALAGPDPVKQPLTDGCQRNPAGLLTFSSPEWVRVGGKSTSAADAAKVIEGTTTLTHTADEDLPQSHTSYDLDTDVIPDPAYIGLLAGSPTARNGNFAEDADYAKLHVEWESRAIPAYAWPTEGDRVKLWGQWVWDCGHWGEGIETDQKNPQGSLIGTGDYFLPGQVEGDPPHNLRGEQTELHPLQAVVVNRKVPWQAPGGEAQTDVFISNDGTHAYAEEKCAHDLSPLPGVPPSYGPDFTACANSGMNEQQPLQPGGYDFFVPAPPRPSPSSQLTYRVIARVNGSAATEQVTETPSGLSVHVAFPDRSGGLAYGTTFLVGWRDPAPAAPAHLRLTVRSVKVVHALDPNPNRFTQTGFPPGEYNLYLDANGYWSFIGGRGPLSPTPDDSWAPGLGAVNDGQTVPVNHAIDFFVPSGAPVRLAVSGRECDLPKMDPCVVTAEVSDGNDHPGQAIAQFASADAAVGNHTLTPDTGNYVVDYAVERIATPSSGPSEPGSSGVPSSEPGGNLGGGGRGTVTPPPPRGCIDRKPPQSKFTARATRRHSIAVRGTAHDLGCSHRVARVTVAIAQRAGGGHCRYVLANGRLGPRGKCRRAIYVSAHGTSHWSYTPSRRLPAGVFVLRSRAIDAAGNVERKQRLKGRLRNFLTVRLGG